MQLDWNQEKLLLEAAVKDAIDQLLADAGTDIKQKVERLGVRVDWEIWDREAEARAKTYGYDLVQQITDSSKKQLGEIIANWIASDAGFPDLVEKLRKIFPPDLPVSGRHDRAQIIAATEVTRVYADARIAGFQAIGLTRMRWRTARDELVCPICAPLGLADDGLGLVGSVTGGFVHPETGAKIEKPPAHVSCRCWIVEDRDELDDLLKQQEAVPLPPPPAEPEPTPPPPPPRGTRP